MLKPIAPGRRVAHEASPGRGVGGEDVEREWLVTAVDDLDGLVDVGHLDEGQHRAEDLVGHHRVVERHPVEHRRREVAGRRVGARRR